MIYNVEKFLSPKYYILKLGGEDYITRDELGLGAEEDLYTYYNPPLFILLQFCNGI
jgi:hypothetical protein